MSALVTSSVVSGSNVIDVDKNTSDGTDGTVTSLSSV